MELILGIPLTRCELNLVDKEEGGFPNPLSIWNRNHVRE